MIQNLEIVPKAMTQKDHDSSTASPDGPSLVFRARCQPLARTCYHLHNDYAVAPKTMITTLEVPTLTVHVLNFDFSPFVQELFSRFEAAHRKHFNDRAGAITIRLTITPSFLEAAEGSDARFNWLEWKTAEARAERDFPVAYKVTRNALIESNEDREALRLFMLLFDPLSNKDGDVCDIVKVVAKFFKAVLESNVQLPTREKGLM
jgi:hypothetical protein